eukprot:6173086-Pleurochrysis_carterae.AAC.2
MEAPHSHVWPCVCISVEAAYAGRDGSNVCYGSACACQWACKHRSRMREYACVMVRARDGACARVSARVRVSVPTRVARPYSSQCARAATSVRARAAASVCACAKRREQRVAPRTLGCGCAGSNWSRRRSRAARASEGSAGST